MNTITILVALYKASKYLPAKLKNLQQQTLFKESTVVLLNCQNLENEVSIYADFLRHPNVKEIRYSEHISLYLSWNDGIRNTESEFIVNANVDDQWHPEYLERSVRFLRNNPEFGVVSSGVLMTTIPNQEWPKWKSHDKIPFHKYPLSTAGPCPVWRRSLHDKYGYFDNYQVIGDARMWEKWDAGGEQFGLIDEDLVLYYLSPQSLERRSDPKTGALLRDIDIHGRPA